MTQSVSNDALWEKLSEIDKKIDKLSFLHQSSEFMQAQEAIIPVIKDEIIAEIKEQAFVLGGSNDSHFEANKKNIKMLNENVILAIKYISATRKQLKLYIESPKDSKESYVDFRLFRLKRGSFIITNTQPISIHPDIVLYEATD